MLLYSVSLNELSLNDLSLTDSGFCHLAQCDSPHFTIHSEYYRHRMMLLTYRFTIKRCKMILLTNINVENSKHQTNSFIQIFNSVIVQDFLQMRSCSI